VVWQESFGDRIVPQLFDLGQPQDGIVKAGDVDVTLGSDERGKKQGEVFQRLIQQGTAVDTAVKVGMIARHHQIGVDDATKSVGQAWNVVIQPVTISQQHPIDISDECLVLSNRLFESLRARFLLSLDQKDDITAKLLLSSEISRCVQRRKDRAFIVGNTASIQKSVDRSQLERIRLPLRPIRVCTNHVVMAVEQYGPADCIG